MTRETPSSHAFIGAFRRVRGRVCCRLNGWRSVDEILIRADGVELLREGRPRASIPTARRLSARMTVAAFNQESGLLAPTVIHAVLRRRQWSSSTRGHGWQLGTGRGRPGDVLVVKTLRTSPFGNNTVRRGAPQAFAADN
jgi:hypothetical protein